MPAMPAATKKGGSCLGLPDVCKTPAGSLTVPIPYPNSAKLSGTTNTPLNAIGIPTIDVIDFDFPWWHTADDTIDKISAQSLQIVGSVALYYLSEFALK